MPDYTLVDTPWGRWEILLVGSKYKVKRLQIDPGECFSVQYHEKRDEHWLIVEGFGEYTFGASEAELRTVPVSCGQYYFVPARQIHRLAAAINDRLVVIETQIGEDCDEADIVRLADKYRR